MDVFTLNCQELPYILPDVTGFEAALSVSPRNISSLSRLKVPLSGLLFETGSRRLCREVRHVKLATLKREKHSLVSVQPVRVRN
jgi:hypothetical protein